MRLVRWSLTGLDQLDSAVNYLAERNPDASERLKARIDDTITNLASRPIGRPGERDGTYEKRVLKTSYLIVYALEPDELRVLRIFHMSQDRSAWVAGED